MKLKATDLTGGELLGRNCWNNYESLGSGATETAKFRTVCIIPSLAVSERVFFCDFDTDSSVKCSNWE